jgi:hypothetical protein
MWHRYASKRVNVNEQVRRVRIRALGNLDRGSHRVSRDPVIDGLPRAAVLARNEMPRRDDWKRRVDEEKTGDPLRNAQHA